MMWDSSYDQQVEVCSSSHPLVPVVVTSKKLTIALLLQCLVERMYSVDDSYVMMKIVMMIVMMKIVMMMIMIKIAMMMAMIIVMRMLANK